MNDAIHNLEKLAAVIERDRSQLNLLALFQREGSSGWELLFAAPWATESKREAIGYVSERAAECLSKEEAARVTGVVILDAATAVLAARFAAPGEYWDFVLNGVSVAHAIFARLRRPGISADRTSAPAAVS